MTANVAVGNTVYSGSTVSFVTHNSGKHTKKRKRSPSRSSNDENNQVAKKKAVSDGQKVDGDLDVVGVVRARGFFQYSDVRLKTDIEDLVDAYSIISNISGKRFTWKKDAEPIDNDIKGKRVIGLLAQEVQKVAPEVIQETEEGWLSVNYAELVPVLISAFNYHIANYEEDKEEMSEQFDQLINNVNDIVVWVWFTFLIIV